MTSDCATVVASTPGDVYLIDHLSGTHSDRRVLETFLTGRSKRLPPQHGKRPAVTEDELGVQIEDPAVANGPARLVMSGSALARLRTSGADLPLLRRVAAQGIRPTRIDIARDTASLTPDWVRERFLKRRFTSRWRGSRPQGDAKNDRACVYIGSTSSDCYVAVYDRRSKVESACIDIPDAQQYRWEMRLRGTQAERVFTRLTACEERVDPDTGEIRWPLGEIFRSELSRRLRITTHRVDTKNRNHHRAKTAPRWAAFVKDPARDMDPAPADPAAPAAEFKRLTRWCVRNAASAVAAVRSAGGDEAVIELADRGRDRLRPSITAYVRDHAEAARDHVRELLHPPTRRGS